MEPKLQRRIQRYGWDLAAPDYEALWQAQLAPAQDAAIEMAGLRPGDRVVDVACGTGLISFAAARAVGPRGVVLGVDISEQMVVAAARRANQLMVDAVAFARMDAEALDLPDASFDAAICALGLMYVPDPSRAVAEMRRALRPGGRVALAVWGGRARCGWASVFPIVEAEVQSDVCPLFFELGAGEALARLCIDAGFEAVQTRRITTRLDYPDGETACAAAFVGGPVALAWSRFDAATRVRTKASYLEAIAPWRTGRGYSLPGEFLVVAARRPYLAASGADLASTAG